MTTIPHRQHIGGAWDEIGKLQFDFMVSRGLKPDSRLLDYGCGSGRGAVYFVPYLDCGNYMGIDQEKSMLDAARHEIQVANSCLGMSKQFTLFSTAKMYGAGITARHDFAVCQSVFTHCHPGQIDMIMSDMNWLLGPAGILYATYFPGQGAGPVTHEPGARTTYIDRDPYHQPEGFWSNQVWSKDWDVTVLGEWDHPRGQHMLEIRRAV